ncbi:UDP-N-acetylmuramoyl-L-alanyl-D-glutamate--2,6-diaminopimelate ligase [Nocardia otitidiscaviarum]|uniref:UDP-N-acetylmuramoyl-L-alanyl-D-glutamate--2, 6-diaminopimelate ligase n=1 Tax=Nocardia otitidiscaviarum TaxID=1823 RepID=UPI0018953F11|nr:UDP-N-acetylmuramoyl-L-alanyl-D-glutamate--2,6-diaminopimelate ligase [Nocardia otitidiscaviarum]MBF6239553.1 UDP-N-acetylmuramoyl-L-alanyl-D-glutamate--2,6-diaminopimelate ligase [Nocardia otitidiscaviarum]
MPAQSQPRSGGSTEPQVLRPADPPATSLRSVAELTGARFAPHDRRSADAALAAAALDDIRVTGIEQRSNAVRPGDLFAGLAGERAHGARFAHDAVARGAVAVLTDAAGADLIGAIEVPVLVRDDPRAVLGALSSALYGDPSRRLRIIGITGTSGKTTTSYLVEAGLTAAGLRTALIGTIETRIGGVRVPSALTTPEAPQLHAMFAVMVERGVQAVVMEVSSHALALGRVDGVEFAVGAFTNLSQDHLDFHADFEDYYAAKRRLFDPASPVGAATSVICVDDAWGRRLAGELEQRTHIVTVSTTQPAHWTAADVTAGPGGTQSFTAARGALNVPVRLRLPGDYNIANGLLAVAVCEAAGVDPAVAAAALGAVDVPGRMQRVDRGQDFLAVVDYAHKPAAVESVIATLRTYLAEQGAGGRLAVVVGAGGDRDAGKRPLMGAAGARGADLLIITDDNPRGEDPAAIRAAVRAGADALPEGQRGEVREVGDRAAAIAAAVDWARPGDAVLVAGKGHETGQEISGVKYPFDDREVLAAALSEKTKDLTVS